VRENVLLAISEVKLVVKAVRVGAGKICGILPHVLYDDSSFAAKVFNVTIFTNDDKIPWFEH
jgi:exoribonuclease II